MLKIMFIKIYNNFERYCIYDSNMERKELKERLKLLKEEPLMYKALYG